MKTYADLSFQDKMLGVVLNILAILYLVAWYKVIVMDRALENMESLLAIGFWPPSFITISFFGAVSTGCLWWRASRPEPPNQRPWTDYLLIGATTILFPLSAMAWLTLAAVFMLACRLGCKKGRRKEIIELFIFVGPLDRLDEIKMEK